MIDKQKKFDETKTKKHKLYNLVNNTKLKKDSCIFVKKCNGSLIKVYYNSSIIFEIIKYKTVDGIIYNYWNYIKTSIEDIIEMIESQTIEKFRKDRINDIER